MAIFSGKKLRAIRKYQDLTAAELAERADICTSIIYSYESGKITPRMQTMELLAAALGVPVVALLTDEARGDVNGGCGGNGQRGSNEGAGRYQDAFAGVTETGSPGDSISRGEMGNSGGVYENKRDWSPQAGTVGGGRDGSEQGYRERQGLPLGIDRLIRANEEEQTKVKNALLDVVDLLPAFTEERNAPMTAACVEAARVLRTCF